MTDEKCAKRSLVGYMLELERRVEWMEFVLNAQIISHE